MQSNPVQPYFCPMQRNKLRTLRADPPLNRRPLSFRSALSEFYVVKSAHRTQSNPVQPLKNMRNPPNQRIGPPRPHKPNPDPHEQPILQSPSLSSMWLSPPLSLAKIPLPRIPLPNLPAAAKAQDSKGMPKRMNRSCSLFLRLSRHLKRIKLSP